MALLKLSLACRGTTLPTACLQELCKAKLSVAYKRSQPEARKTHDLLTACNMVQMGSLLLAGTLQGQAECGCRAQQAAS